MLRYVFAAMAMACVPASHAQTKSEFKQFARTRDSLMHIAYYDKDLDRYKREFDAMLAGFHKLPESDRKEYQRQLEEEYYYLAMACARKGDKQSALDNLERSGTLDYGDLMDSYELKTLRSEPRFMRLADEAKNRKSEYVLTLRKDATYNESEGASIPAFRYQSATAPMLVQLKETYNIDSIAGKGNDVSKAINLMKWVHYLVPHNGSTGNPDGRNAMNMIAECRKDGKTLNCRGLAITLNEVYLAAGFKSRFVTCLPKDTADNDCHVINVVWIPSLNKWVWMDPTFMAYVMDETGNLLSIEEVRNRIVTDKPLILNPDANRNHGASQTKDWYLDNYMAKNLYKLECPVSSEYDYETRKDGKKRAYVQLLPGTTAPKAKVTRNAHGVESYKLSYTVNPKVFWAAPEGTARKDGKMFSGRKRADYEEFMAKLKMCYNKKDMKLATALMPSMDEQWLEHLFSDGSERYGKILSCTYMGKEEDNRGEDIALFKMNCEKSVHCMAFSLNEHNQPRTFRFKTYSNYIDWRLAKAIEEDRKMR